MRFKFTKMVGKCYKMNYIYYVIYAKYTLRKISF